MDINLGYSNQNFQKLDEFNDKLKDVIKTIENINPAIDAENPVGEDSTGIILQSANLQFANTAIIHVLSQLIHRNFTLIASQTGNKETAPQLQAKLLELSKVIEKIPDSTKEQENLDKNNLAFEIMCFANGLFSDTSKETSSYFDKLPPEMQKNIISNLINKDTITSIGYFGYQRSSERRHTPLQTKQSLSTDIRTLNTLPRTSKQLDKLSSEIKDDLMKKVPLINVFDDINVAISYVIKNDLKTNLFQFDGSKKNGGSRGKLRDMNLISTIENHPGLKNLAINSNAIKTAPLGDLKNLEILHIGPKCTSLSGKRLVTHFSNFKALKELNLKGCTHIGEKSLQKMLSQVKGTITKLNLSKCTQITGDELCRMTDLRENLIELNLSGCTGLKGDKLEKMLSKFPNLEVLDISACPGVGEKELVKILSTLPKLKTLKIPIELENKTSELKLEYPKLQFS